MSLYAFLRLLSHDISIWGDSFLFWTKSRVLLSLEQLLHPIQYTAWKNCQCSSLDTIFLPRVIGILSNSDQLHYLWGTSCFGDGTRQCWGFPYQSWSLNMLFVCIFRMSILGRNYFSWFNLFSFWCVLKYHFQAANCCLYTLFSGYCHMIFPFEEILSFSGQNHVFYLVWNSCFILYNTPLAKNVNVTQKINLFCQVWPVFFQLQINFIIFEVQVASVTVHDNVEDFRISREV